MSLDPKDWEVLADPIPINVNGRDGFIRAFCDKSGESLIRFNDGSKIILGGDVEASLCRRVLQ